MSSPTNSSRSAASSRAYAHQTNTKRIYFPSSHESPRARQNEESSLKRNEWHCSPQHPIHRAVPSIPYHLSVSSRYPPYATHSLDQSSYDDEHYYNRARSGSHGGQSPLDVKHVAKHQPKEIENNETDETSRRTKPPVKKRKMIDDNTEKQAELAQESSDDVTNLSRSERKRRREMKRRSDVNRGFDDLTALLTKMNPPEFRVDGEGMKGDTSVVASFNRVDLIARTVRVLERLYKENAIMAGQIKLSEAKTKDEKKKIEDVMMMFPIMVPTDRIAQPGDRVPMSSIPLPPVAPPSLLFDPRATIYNPSFLRIGDTNSTANIVRESFYDPLRLRWMGVERDRLCNQDNNVDDRKPKSPEKKTD